MRDSIVIIMSKDDINMGGGWHLKKEVTIGQIVTLLSILITGIWWASAVETRLATLKASDQRIEEKTEILLSNMNDRFDRYQHDVSKALLEINKGITRLNDKLDEKVDR